MAILTALFSALSRKVGDLLQAVFGWSIAALFGKLSSKKQVLISVALILSLCWPIFVIGAFVPAAASFIIAFIPIKNLVADNVLRVVWISMAVVAPILVGIITRVVSPDARKNNFFVSVINGYPLALGFAASFLIALVTVPALKIASVVRRWNEEHVYVQPKKDRYSHALAQISEACVMVGLEPRQSEVPLSMALATKVIKLFSRGAVDSLIISHPQMIRAKGIELYLYPADLLIRGDTKIIAHVRATLSRTLLERDAYLVPSERAQDLQDELGRLWEAIDRHPSVDEIGDSLKTRLKEVVADITKANLTFDECVLLDRIAHRIENKLLDVHSFIEDVGAEKTYDEVKGRFETPPQRSNASTPQLIETAFREAKELIQIELALAKDEIAQEVKGAAGAATGFVLALCFVSAMFALLGVAALLALKGGALIALAVAGGFLLLTAIAAAVAYSMLPTKLLPRTRKHLNNDLKQLREHVA